MHTHTLSRHDSYSKHTLALLMSKLRSRVEGAYKQAKGWLERLKR